MTDNTKCIRGCGRIAQYNSKTGFMPCKECVAEDRKFKLKKPPEFYTISKQHRIQEQRDQYGKDFLQLHDEHGKMSKDFVEAYPEYAETYFEQEDLAKI